MDKKSLEILADLYERLEIALSEKARDEARLGIFYFVKGYICARMS